MEIALDQLTGILMGVMKMHDKPLKDIRLTDITYQPSVNLLKIETESLGFNASTTVRIYCPQGSASTESI